MVTTEEGILLRIRTQCRVGAAQKLFNLMAKTDVTLVKVDFAFFT